ncbi:type I glyceraldehyde-3-phosphate dehydrogenase [Roseovarius sp. A21]|uniref:Glyceraldehyde-3-phosphate dehydrogenase n=1 Tax=Roseovarius bejariae TaxID=2576383 RepID=A0A844CNI1_9RHOB|nr:type I glyceraldehyde-3-phosphate dehydrogenase [Roseovarius bejariae]MRU16911.1 type I glyceraldehyde-3-phosphate dehydrogenase [Roseovarius bejariae]
MTVKVAINGFGRIGRNVLRAIVESGRTDLRVVAINDLAPVETNAHLLEFDSVHGRFPAPVKTNKNSIDVGQGPILVTALRDPAELPWQDVDIVMECTGIFTDRDKAAIHLENGAKRVLVSAPSKGADRTVVFGVNHEQLTADDLIVSNASCTTNCLAPVAKALHDAIGITRGFMTTIHSYTGDQPTLDTAHKDLYRARAAALNMIPTTTGAARAVGLVLPDLAGKLDGTAIRVPTPNVSAVDLTFETTRPTTPEEINQIIGEAAQGPLAGVLDLIGRELVSSDFNHNPASSVFATDQTRVMEDGTMCRILSWYDNEWGFSNRMADTAAAMGKLLRPTTAGNAAEKPTRAPEYA